MTKYHLKKNEYDYSTKDEIVWSGDRFRMFRVGRSDRPDAVRMEGTGAKRYLSGNGFAERMARRRP